MGRKVLINLRHALNKYQYFIDGIAKVSRTSLVEFSNSVSCRDVK